MSFGLALGQLANSFQGAMGAVESMGRANLANEEINNRREDREHMKAERERQKRELDRQEALQNELSRIDEDVTQDFRNPSAPQFDDSDDPANPTPSAASLPATRTRPATMDERLRRAATAYKNAGNFDKFIELTAGADKIAFNRAAQAFEQFDAGSSNLDTLGYVKQAADIFTNDPFAGKVENIRQNPDGTVSYDVVNTSSGQRFQRSVRSVDEARNQLRAYYSPETFARLQESRAKALSELEAERLKPYELRPGEMRVDPVSGQKTRNDTGFINIGTDENPQLVPTGRAGTAGSSSRSTSASGGSSRGGAVDPAKAAADAWEFVATKGEIKLQPNQLAQGLRISQDVARAGVDPSLAVEVAMEIVNDPNKAKLELSFDTGTVSLVYRNPRVNEGRAIQISPNAGTLQELEKSAGGRQQMAGVAQELLSTMVASKPEAERAQYGSRLVAIARDPELTRSYLRQLQESGRDTTIAARQLEILRTYTPKDDNRGGGNATDRSESWVDRIFSRDIKQPETDPNSAAGKFQAGRAEAAEVERRRQEQRLQQQQEISQQFAADKSSMDPIEFVRKYDATRSQLSRQDLMELRRIENQAFRSNQ